MSYPNRSLLRWPLFTVRQRSFPHPRDYLYVKPACLSWTAPHQKFELIHYPNPSPNFLQPTLFSRPISSLLEATSYLTSSFGMGTGKGGNSCEKPLKSATEFSNRRVPSWMAIP